MATLKDLFDYQKFAENARMGNLIRDTESRYGMKEEDSGSEIWQANSAPDPDKKDMLWNKP